MDVERAEMAGEGALRLRRQMLVGEKEHQALVKRIAEGVDRLVGDRLGEVEALDAAADRWRQRLDRERRVAKRHLDSPICCQSLPFQGVSRRSSARIVISMMKAMAAIARMPTMTTSVTRKLEAV
jgi:hypothetical protein